MATEIATVLVGIIWPILFIIGIIKPRYLLFWTAQATRWRVILLMLFLLATFLGIGLVLDSQLVGIVFIFPMIGLTLFWSKQNFPAKTEHADTVKTEVPLAAQNIPASQPMQSTDQNDPRLPEEEMPTSSHPSEEKKTGESVLVPPHALSNEVIRIPSFSGNGEYTLLPAEARCSCPDWEKSRCPLPLSSPSRACKHLVRYYAEHPTYIPKSFKGFAPMFIALSEAKRGMPSGEECRHGELNGQLYAFGIKARSWPWVDVMVNQDSYGLNVEENRWARGIEPRYPLSLFRRVCDACGLDHGSIRQQPYRTRWQPTETAETHDVYYEGYSGLQEVPRHESTIDGDVVPFLKDALGTLPEGLKCVERKSYFVVYGTNPRNWFCRVMYNPYGLTKAELFNGYTVGITNGHIYRKSQNKFVRLAGVFDWKSYKK